MTSDIKLGDFDKIILRIFGFEKVYQVVHIYHQSDIIYSGEPLKYTEYHIFTLDCR